jgi:gliding motility-associated-like protein
VVLSSNFASGNRWSTNPVRTTQTIVLKQSLPSITLEVTDTNGCQNTAGPIAIVVNSLPSVTLLKDTAITIGEDLDLVAIGFPSNAQTFNWYGSQALIGSTNSPSFNIEPSQTGIFEVELIDSNGCRAADSVLVRVSRELYVPNMFSPNNDGKNDRFKVYGFGVESIEVKVWDRLGNLVYETNKVDQIVETSESENTVPGWDGKFKGKELGQESYIWNVKGKFTTGEDLKVRGGNNSGSVIIMN